MVLSLLFSAENLAHLTTNGFLTSKLIYSTNPTVYDLIVRQVKLFCIGG